MINNVVLVGRLAKDPNLYEFDDNTKVCNILLAVQRPFREMQTGEYLSDLIPVSLWNGISKTCYEYCKKGDTIAIKGRIHMKVKDENGTNKYTMEVYGEQLAFVNIKNKKIQSNSVSDEQEFNDEQDA